MKNTNIVALPERIDDDRDYFVRLVNSHQQQMRREEALRREQKQLRREMAMHDASVFLTGVAAALIAVLIFF